MSKKAHTLIKKHFIDKKVLIIPSLLGKWHPQTCSRGTARNPHSVKHEEVQEKEVCLGREDLTGVRQDQSSDGGGDGAQRPSASHHLEAH